MEITKEKLINKWKEICTSAFYLNKEENEENLLQNSVIYCESGIYYVKPSKNIEFCIGAESQIFAINSTSDNSVNNNKLSYYISIIYKGFILYKKFDITEEEFNELTEIHSASEAKYRSEQIEKYQKMCESEIKGLMSFGVDQESGKLVLKEN